jgi:hypothetical protein
MVVLKLLYFSYSYKHFILLWYQNKVKHNIQFNPIHQHNAIQYMNQINKLNHVLGTGGLLGWFPVCIAVLSPLVGNILFISLSLFSALQKGSQKKILDTYST